MNFSTRFFNLIAAKNWVGLLVFSAYGIVLFLAGLLLKELVTGRERDDLADERVSLLESKYKAREDSIVRYKDAEKDVILARELADKNRIISRYDAKFEQLEMGLDKRDMGLARVERKVNSAVKASNQIYTKPKK